MRLQCLLLATGSLAKPVHETVAIVGSLRPPSSAEMKYLPIFGLTVALVCYADLAVAKTPAEIESSLQRRGYANARAVTVEITLLQDNLNQAAKLYQQQGNTQNYQRAIDLLRKLGQPSGN